MPTSIAAFNAIRGGMDDISNAVWRGILNAQKEKDAAATRKIREDAQALAERKQTREETDSDAQDAAADQFAKDTAALQPIGKDVLAPGSSEGQLSADGNPEPALYTETQKPGMDLAGAVATAAAKNPKAFKRGASDVVTAAMQYHNSQLKEAAERSRMEGIILGLQARERIAGGNNATTITKTGMQVGGANDRTAATIQSREGISADQIASREGMNADNIISREKVANDHLNALAVSKNNAATTAKINAFRAPHQARINQARAVASDYFKIYQQTKDPGDKAAWLKMRNQERDAVDNFANDTSELLSPDDTLPPAPVTNAATPNLNPPAVAPAATSSNRAPAVGEIRKGFRFLGGNPASRDNWEPAQ